MTSFLAAGCGFTCERWSAASTRFFAGRSECPNTVDGGVSLGAPTGDACADSLPSCTAVDHERLQRILSCVEAAPACTSGNERAALESLNECLMQGATALSPACVPVLD